MKFMTYLITFVIILGLAILKVMHAAESEDPCPSQLDHTVAAMCSDDSVVEEGVYGAKDVDSLLLRITKQQNNCICQVTLQNTVTNDTIYMSKYKGQSSAAPEQENCGLAVDVDYVDTSDTTRSLQSIECTSGTSLRSIALGGNELKLKSRIITGDFTRGYCIQIYRRCQQLSAVDSISERKLWEVTHTNDFDQHDQVIYNCNMIDQVNYSGSDDDWIKTNGEQHINFDQCKTYCLRTKACVAVHYQSNYCFVYNRTTVVIRKDDSTYSQKHCVDTQKLKIRCFPPDSTTQTNQLTTTEDTFTTKFETVTKPISDNHVTNFNTESTIEREKENIKDTSTSFLVALVIAVIGCTVAVFFAGTTVFYKRQLHTQKSKIPLASSVNYVDLSGARDVSNYSAINTLAVNEQQYETVNART